MARIKRVVLAFALIVAACAPSQAVAPSSSTPAPETSAVESLETPPTSTTSIAKLSTTSSPQPLTVTSPAFEDGALIPTEFTCDGTDVSPPLEIEGLPSGTKSVVVVVEDPDSALGTWDHWVRYDIQVEPDELELPEAASRWGKAGVNSWNVVDYMGPCPPDGEEHRYFFTVYALSEDLGLPEGVDAATVYEEMESLLISSDELMGRYGS